MVRTAKSAPYLGNVGAIPKIRWALRAVQHEYRLSIRADDVDMNWAMIVQVDHHPQAIESELSRHKTVL